MVARGLPYGSGRLPDVFYGVLGGSCGITIVSGYQGALSDC